MTHFSPVPEIRPTPDDRFPTNPLLSLRIPEPDRNGILHHGFSLQGPVPIPENQAAIRKALFLAKEKFYQTIETLANRQSPGYSVAEALPKLSEGYMGASTVICVRPHDHASKELFVETGDFFFPGSSESTTPYLAEHGMVATKSFRYSAKTTGGFTSPMYCLDDRAIEIINQNPVGRQILPQILEALHPLSLYAEHDYVHALTMLDRNAFNMVEDGDPYHGGIYEKWSLAVHAAVCAEMFTDKRCKQEYLGLVENYFGAIVELQQALGTGTKEALDVVTYFAEIGNQRITRVMRPDDDDLQNSTAGAAINRLQLSVPPSVTDRRDYDRFDSLRKLWVHNAITMGAPPEEYRSVFLPYHNPDLKISIVAQAKDSSRIDMALSSIRLLSFQQYANAGGRIRSFEA